MEKNNKRNESMTFEDAIWLALHTPHKTRKELDEIRKKEKAKKQKKKN